MIHVGVHPGQVKVNEPIRERHTPDSPLCTYVIIRAMRRMNPCDNRADLPNIYPSRALPIGKCSGIPDTRLLFKLPSAQPVVG